MIGNLTIFLFASVLFVCVCIFRFFKTLIKGNTKDDDIIEANNFHDSPILEMQQEQDSVNQDMTFAQRQRAEVLNEIRFHEEYLRCGLTYCETTPENLDLVTLPQSIPGLFDLVNLVLFPGEILPLVVNTLLLGPSERFLAVSASRDDEDNESGRNATLAQIMASAIDQDNQYVLVRGIRKIKFKESSPFSGTIVEEIPDTIIPKCPTGFAGKIYMDTLLKEELNESSWLTCSKQIPLSAEAKLKFYSCDNPLTRRLFIRGIKQLDKLPIYCRACIFEHNAKTTLSQDARRLISKVTCINPNGYMFNLLLLPDSAIQPSSIVSTGPAHVEHSWFSGYTWSFAMCRVCFAHIGWRYLPKQSNNNGRPFWGFRSTEISHADEEMNRLLRILEA